MKALILCAGLGTRLKPWTESHPKALVPVGRVPMLKRVCDSLCEQSFNEITVNVHHFANQIIEFLDNDEVLKGRVMVSDESEKLLDTGGGILHAEKILAADPRPFLVHNVDILSNADLQALMAEHIKSGRHVSLLVSDRKSDRKLVFDQKLGLKGWLNIKTNQAKPEGLEVSNTDKLMSFSGIYVMDPEVFVLMKENGFEGAFPIMNFFLSGIHQLRIGGVVQDGLEIIDIGKPDTLHRANLEIQ